MEFKEFGLKDVEASGGGVVAYASTFDREPDSYGDVVAKGAFARTLKEWEESGNVIPLLYGHDTTDPWMNIGSIDAAEEDERGLKVTATFDESNETAQYVRKLVTEKRVTKLSFAFDVRESGETTLEDGTKAHELRDLDLFEVSIVPIPANRHAEVVEAKQRERKEGRVISKKTNDALREVADALKRAEDAIEEALEGLDALSAGDEGDQGGDGGNSEGGEGSGNEEAEKARILAERINEALKEG